MAISVEELVIALIVAPFIGSFLSVLVVRLPKGEDVVAARSRCQSCGKTLSPVELLPLVSWVAQGGKCRACGAGVPWLYPVLELGALVPVVWAASVGVSALMFWATVVLGWTLLALAVMDLRAFILADALTLPLIAAPLLAVLLWVPEELIWHTLGAAAGFGLMIGVAQLYKALRGRDGLGMGDAKLMAAAGAWTGLESIGTVLLYGTLASLVLVGLMRIAGRQFDAATPVPFGAGLALGFWLTWLYGPLFLGR
jgi:leader peptidase (prepilin peptidase)/N-methyltransferase